MESVDMNSESIRRLINVAYQDTRSLIQSMRQQLIDTQVKLKVSEQAQMNLAEQVKMAEVVRRRLGHGSGSSNVANHPIAMRLSSLRGTYHMISRYQLKLLKNIMTLKQALGMNMDSEMLSWDSLEEQVMQDPPNLHTVFPWSLEVEEHNGQPQPRATPWRPTE